jgi:hypothetical protein
MTTIANTNQFPKKLIINMCIGKVVDMLGWFTSASFTHVIATG